MTDPQIHSDIKDRNYLSREQEIEAKEGAIKLQLKLGLGLVALVAVVVAGNLFLS